MILDFAPGGRASHVAYGLRSLPGATAGEQIGTILLNTTLKTREAERLAFYVWLLATGKVDPDGRLTAL